MSRKPQDGTAKTVGGRSRTFREAVEPLVRRGNSPLWRCIAGYLPVVAVALGYGLRALLGPAGAMGAVTGLALGSFGTIAGVMSRVRVDWASADDYNRELRAMMPEWVLAVVEETETRLRDLGHEIVYLFRMSCRCSAGDVARDRGCRCRERWRAASGSLPGGRVLLLVGDQVLTDPEVLRFALAHELTHLRRALMAVHAARLIGATVGAAIAGVFAPGIFGPGIAGLIIPAGALLVIHVLWSWAIELTCDREAARRHGAAAFGFWREYRRNVARPGRSARGARRVLWWVAALVPEHPPLWLRAWQCRRVHARAAAAA
jgi:hypothetical protein